MSEQEIVTLIEAGTRIVDAKNNKQKIHETQNVINTSNQSQKRNSD